MSPSELLRAYDECWCALDFVALSGLWEQDSPQPIYLGDEYPEPLVGAEELDRHWSRVASRLKAASVSSTLHSYDQLSDAVARCVLLSRWRLTGRDSDLERTGTSWITWLLVRRGEQFRIFHHMEAQVYLAGGTDASG